MKLKFLTLNIEHGGQLMAEALSFLQKEDPDILFLQEAQSSDEKTDIIHFNTIDAVGERLGYAYHLFAPQYEVRLHSILVKNGNAIFSKFPLKQTNQFFFDVPYGAVDHQENKKRQDFSQIPQSGLHATALIEGREIDLVNVQGIWGMHGRDTERRLEMARTIVEEIKGTTTCILAGDFNVQPDTKTIAMITENLHSVFGTSLTTTFNMKRKDNPGYATAVVDMIFVSHDIKVLSSQCAQVEISDHLPLVCELEL